MSYFMPMILIHELLNTELYLEKKRKQNK